MTTKLPAERPVLRLVKADEATPVAAAGPEAAMPTKPKRESALVSFMAAYADAIDRDIRLLLEI